MEARHTSFVVQSKVSRFSSIDTILTCISNYGFAPPAAPNPNRPGAGGTCYSDILNTVVTKYDQESLSGLIFFSTSGQAYAHPFDGFAYQGNQIATADPPATVNPQPPSTASNPQPATNIQPAPTPGANSPSAPGISTHSSSTAVPSAIAVSTLSSSVIAVSTIASSVVVFSTIPPSIITVYNSNSISTVDASSSLFTNPSATATTGLSLSSSSSPPSRSMVLTGGQIAGMVIGIVLGIAILVSALLVFCRRRRKSTGSLPSQLDDTHIRYPAKVPSTSGSSSGAASTLGKRPNYLSSEDPASKRFEMATCREAPEPFEMGSNAREILHDDHPGFSRPLNRYTVSGLTVDYENTAVSTFSPVKP